MMNFRFFIFLFLVIFIDCSQSEEDIIVEFIKNTTEVVDFCNQVLPCIKEEVSKAFTKMPQQKAYLLTKTTELNCKMEQGRKINSKINFTYEQIERFKNEVQIRKKKMSLENHLSFMEQFLNEAQKEVLSNYVRCTMIIRELNNCKAVKETFKKNSHCLLFFEEN